LGANLVFTDAFLKKNISIIEGLTFTYQKCSILLFFLVLFFWFLVDVALWCISAFLSLRDLNKRDIALIRAYGFENMITSS
jgi:ABC-type transport system involved in Fe-S cluster assembly fused permease/ATPase subunit